MRAYVRLYKTGRRSVGRIANERGARRAIRKISVRRVVTCLCDNFRPEIAKFTRARTYKEVCDAHMLHVTHRRWCFIFFLLSYIISWCFFVDSQPECLDVLIKFVKTPTNSRKVAEDSIRFHVTVKETVMRNVKWVSKNIEKMSKNEEKLSNGVERKLQLNEE